MNKKLFYEYLQGDKELSEESLLQLKQMTQMYPYFQTAKLIFLKNLQANNDDNFTATLTSFAVECADRKSLFYYLNDGRFARFLSKEGQEDDSQNDRTELLLHSFLESLDEKDADNSKRSNNQGLITESIVSTDYLAYLEQSELDIKNAGNQKDAKPMKHQQLVDSFLEKSLSDEALFSTDKRQVSPSNSSNQDIDNLLDDDTFLTETLAQVYIKQKKYEQALTIIKRLSLNFPKKSIYFADQMRFLEYLIINDTNKKQK